MKKVVIIASFVFLAINSFAADSDGIAYGTGMEASRSELAPRTNIQYYKEMAASVKRHGTNGSKKITIMDNGKGVGNVYVEKHNGDIYNETNIGKGAVIIQE